MKSEEPHGIKTTEAPKLIHITDNYLPYADLRFIHIDVFLQLRDCAPHPYGKTIGY